MVGKESSFDVCEAGADEGNAIVWYWSLVDAAWLFELENEEESVNEDDDDEEEEEEEEDDDDDNDDDDDDDDGELTDVEEVVAILEPPPNELSELSELCREQYDCCWRDLPNGTRDFICFFTLGFNEKCVLNSFVSGAIAVGS